MHGDDLNYSTNMEIMPIPFGHVNRIIGTVINARFDRL